MALFTPLNHTGQMRMHMQGRWFAFAVAAVFITYFVTGLRHSLAQRELELWRARSLASGDLDAPCAIELADLGLGDAE